MKTVPARCNQLLIVRWSWILCKIVAPDLVRPRSHPNTINSNKISQRQSLKPMDYLIRTGRLRAGARIDWSLGRRARRSKQQCRRSTLSTTSFAKKLAPDSSRKCTRWVLSLSLSQSWSPPLGDSKASEIFAKTSWRWVKKEICRQFLRN